jgi:hypothetical protein
MRFRTIDLTGSSQVKFLWVGFGSATRSAPVNPLGHAGCARAVRPARPRRIQPEADFQLRNSFSFSNLFCKLQMNLNSNQI